MKYENRTAAGNALAKKLHHLRRESLVIFGISNAGIAVAAQVAHNLGAPLNTVAVEKIAYPWDSTAALGATSPDGSVYTTMRPDQADAHWYRRSISVARHDARSRYLRLEDAQTAVSARGRTAVLVDDAVMSGTTMRAAIDEVRRSAPARIIIATPLMTVFAHHELAQAADDLIALQKIDKRPPSLSGFFGEYKPVSDEEARSMLNQGAVAYASLPDPDSSRSRWNLPHDAQRAVMRVRGIGSPKQLLAFFESLPAHEKRKPKR